MTFIEKIFHLHLDGEPAWKRGSVRLAQYLAGMATEFNKDKCIIRAQGMAYTSLLALVPLVAIMFAMFAAFPAFSGVKQKVQEMLFSQFIPAKQEVIIEKLDQFASNADKLGLIGLIIFLLGAVMLLDNIEKNFNEIWAVNRKRKFVNKLTAYTTILVFGTFLLGASFSITAKIKSALRLDGLLQVGFFSHLSLWLTPLFMSFLVFLLMYKLIPYTKVKIRSAMVGAFIGSVLFELAKGFLGKSISSSVKYHTIYGSMAALPIFLVGLYLMWMVVLIGLEITYTHQNFRALLHHRTFSKPAGRDRLALVLKFFTLIAARFYKGEEPPTSENLSDRFGIPGEIAEEYMDLLMERKLIREVAGSEGYLPAISLDRITLKDVIGAVFSDNQNNAIPGKPLDRTVDETLSLFQEAGFQAIGNRTFLEYLKTFEEEELPIRTS